MPPEIFENMFEWYIMALAFKIWTCNFDLKFFPTHKMVRGLPSIDQLWQLCDDCMCGKYHKTYFENKHLGDL